MRTPDDSPEFADFEDPEDVDWVPPPVPNEADLPVNTRAWGPFYRWAGPSSQHGPIALAVTREIHPPWHVGIGIGVRWRGRGYAVGLWWKSRPPQILVSAPRQTELRSVIAKADMLGAMKSEVKE